MSAKRPDLGAAVAAAFESDEVQALIGAVEGTGSEPEATAQDTDGAPPAAPQGEDGPDVVTEGGESEQAEAPEGTAVDVPDSYFGVDLSDIPVEKRAIIIRELQERDERIRSVMQRNAELAKKQEASSQEAASESQQAQPATPPTSETLTDEEILAAFGLSKDDPMYEVKAEILLPVAKQQLELSSKLETLLAEREAERALAYWDEALDKLEAEFGQVPQEIGGRDVVIEYAIENGITDPAAAYHAVTAGARKMLQEAAQKARQEALSKLKRASAGTTRPRPQNAEPVQEVRAPLGNLAEAVKQAAMLAEQTTGLSWDGLTSQ